MAWFYLYKNTCTQLCIQLDIYCLVDFAGDGNCKHSVLFEQMNDYTRLNAGIPH